MEEEKTREFPEPEGSGTKQYLEEMQRIFAVREATYQKRKQEHEQKSRDLQKIQTELGRQYQSLEGQKQELASAQQKLADQEAANRKEQEALQREKQDFEQTKKFYEGQQQELLMKSRLELEQLRNERMEAEDLKREYEYKIGQQECGIPQPLPDLSAYVPKLEYEAVKQEWDALFQEKQTQSEELAQLREENQHLTTQLRQKELLLKQLGEERTSLLKKLLESKQEPPQEPEKEKEVLQVENESDSAEVISEEMDAAEENEWRQRPLRVSVKEQEITREELTATVLQKYLQNNHPEFEQLEIRHSEQGEQLHGEVGKLSYAFLFFEDLIQFDISAKRKGGKELEEKLERIGKKVPGVQFQYSKGEGRVYASGFLTKELTPKQAMKQVFEIADYFRG